MVPGTWSNRSRIMTQPLGGYHLSSSSEERCSSFCQVSFSTTVGEQDHQLHLLGAFAAVGESLADPGNVPSNGTLLTISYLSVFIRPPMTMMSPLLACTTVSDSRIELLANGS